MSTIQSRLSSALLTALLFVPSIVPVRADTIDDFVSAQMESKHIPGMAIAVVKDGKPVKVSGYGVVNVETKTPVTADSVFFIGSVSKQIIAATIMQLVNDGKLSLDDVAVKYLDAAPDAWKGITVRHLLTHTSGLVRESPGFNPMKAVNEADVIKAAYATPLVFKTGEKWQYSNLGYFVLAEIISKVSEKPWPDVVGERVFAKLNMTATGTVEPSPPIPPRVTGYVYRNDKYSAALRYAALRPSGAFQSTLNDMIKWDAALNQATILPEQTLDAMWTPVTLSDGTSQPYGYGFQIEQYGSHRVISHGGSLSGFRSWYLRLPDDNISVIVLTNNEIAPTDAIAAGVASQYVNELFPKYEYVAVASDKLATLIGSYQLQGGRSVEIAAAENGLLLKFAGGFELLMLPSGPRKFYSPDDPRRSFEFGNEGEVTRLTMFFNGRQNGVATKKN